MLKKNRLFYDFFPIVIGVSSSFHRSWAAPKDGVHEIWARWDEKLDCQSKTYIM